MVGPDKIIFGSDYPLLPISRYLKEMEEADLPEDWREMILGENLAKLLALTSCQLSAVSFQLELFHRALIVAITWSSMLIDDVRWSTVAREEFESSDPWR